MPTTGTRGTLSDALAIFFDQPLVGEKKMTPFDKLLQARIILQAFEDFPDLTKEERNKVKDAKTLLDKEFQTGYDPEGEIPEGRKIYLTESITFIPVPINIFRMHEKREKGFLIELKISGVFTKKQIEHYILYLIQQIYDVILICSKYTMPIKEGEEKKEPSPLGIKERLRIEG